MAKLLVTGASGYIGSRFVAVAKRDGHTVVALGARPVPGIRTIPWTLGAELPPGAFDGVDAVVHLAHSWLPTTSGAMILDDVNLQGSCALAAAALAHGVRRFVFVSSVSARENALNRYGRVKCSTEVQLLALPASDDVIACARVGLVYGGPLAGQYGLMRKLTGMTPVLPMIGVDREVQPIHRDEVCQGLLTLALLATLPRHVHVLAGPKPMRFGAWLQLLRRAETGRDLVLIPLPERLALLACKILSVMPIVDPERILGLISTAFVPSERDIGALGLAIADPSAVLLADRRNRESVREAALLLHYLMGRKAPIKAVARLARAIRNGGDEPVHLSPWIARFPGLLRLFEPVGGLPAHRLARHLGLAAMVVEALPPEGGRGRRTTILGAVLQVSAEAVALPFRLALRRVYS